MALATRRAARHRRIWSGTDQYKSGKYVRDGVYDPEVVDSQYAAAPACCWR